MDETQEENIVVLISANAEWQVTKEILTPPDLSFTPFGERFSVVVEGIPLEFVQGGWGKISAASSAQYVIDKWHPKFLINLGTCGGFSGFINKGAVLLVEETIVYDIFEKMGDPDEALQVYSTRIDLSWLPDPLPDLVQRARLISGDQDICPGDIPHLQKRFGAIAADWESGAIAWVACRNQVRCFILRGVSDLVSEDGEEAYDHIETFFQGTRQVMGCLINQLPLWLTAMQTDNI
jgi:adenosylhomocysteine nucleosidase